MKKINLESNSIDELWQGSSLELLKALHILTRDGKLNQDSRRKLKQVYHLVQLIEPYLEKAFSHTENPNIVDMGSGKSYLGFLLYDLILSKKEGGAMVSIESRTELISKSKDLAKKSNFVRMEFQEAYIENAKWQEGRPLSMVCALHACDTATDDAILFGLKYNAQSFALVPCCQAEVARLLDKIKYEELDSLWSAAIHKREFGSHLTNVLRVLALKAKGYSVTVTELVGWEHSMKNEIILAEKTSSYNKVAHKKLENLLEAIPVANKLIKNISF